MSILLTVIIILPVAWAFDRYGRGLKARKYEEDYSQKLRNKSKS